MSIDFFFLEIIVPSLPQTGNGGTETTFTPRKRISLPTFGKCIFRQCRHVNLKKFPVEDPLEPLIIHGIFGLSKTVSQKNSGYVTDLVGRSLVMIRLMKSSSS